MDACCAVSAPSDTTRVWESPLVTFLRSDVLPGKVAKRPQLLDTAHPVCRHITLATPIRCMMRLTRAAIPRTRPHARIRYAHSCDSKRGTSTVFILRSTCTNDRARGTSTRRHPAPAHTDLVTPALVTEYIAPARVAPSFSDLVNPQFSATCVEASAPKVIGSLLFAPVRIRNKSLLERRHRTSWGLFL